MKQAEIDRKFDEIVAFAEVEQFLDTPVKRYSIGMYVRLAFAVAAHLEPEILIVDEVLAVGDAAFQKKCLGKMQDVAGHGRTVLFVSHNMQSIAALTRRCLVFQGGRLVIDAPTDQGIRAFIEMSLKGSEQGEAYRNEGGKPDDNYIAEARGRPRSPTASRSSASRSRSSSTCTSATPIVADLRVHGDEQHGRQGDPLLAVRPRPAVPDPQGGVPAPRRRPPVAPLQRAVLADDMGRRAAGRPRLRAPDRDLPLRG